MFHVDLDVFLVVFPFRLHASQNSECLVSNLTMNLFILVPVGSPPTTPKFSANGLTQRLPLA